LRNLTLAPETRENLIVRFQVRPEARKGGGILSVRSQLDSLELDIHAA